MFLMYYDDRFKTVMSFQPSMEAILTPINWKKLEEC